MIFSLVGFYNTRVYIGTALLFASSIVSAAPATGPLRPHPQNPRYFTNTIGDSNSPAKVIYLTGSHTWNNLVDMAPEGESTPLDFSAYLDFLERHGHNFIRLWTWELTRWDTRTAGVDASRFVHVAGPLPWRRVGPAAALDGRPKFDLAQFDPEYFERLRGRVQAAQQRGIYVSVMLFEGWALRHSLKDPKNSSVRWSWRAHPFHPENHVNGLHVETDEHGVGLVHGLGDAALNRIQLAYIHRVIDAVNGFDNVLFEVINEGGEQRWNWWVARAVHEYEQAKPKQHPVGITGHGAENLASMLASPATWISPGRKDGFGDDPPPWDGRKISILDTDHIWGIGGSAAWVWKSFLSGHNPIFMDPYEARALETAAPRRWESVRRALGDARRFAERVDLVAMIPHPDLASTDYCLAAPGAEYLVFQQKAGDRFTVELEAGTYHCEWFDPQNNTGEPAEPVEVKKSGRRVFQPPFDGTAVLYLRRQTRS